MKPSQRQKAAARRAVRRSTSTSRNTSPGPSSSSAPIGAVRNTAGRVGSRNQLDRARNLRPVVSIRLEPKTLDRLDAIAKELQTGWRAVPRSFVIEQAIDAFIRSHTELVAKQKKAVSR